MDKITFNNPGTFSAARAAEKWLADRGFSIGSSQVAPSLRAIWYGDCSISKWRNLSAKERASCHAIMEGDERDGPVTIRLTKAASVEAIEAFQKVFA